MNAVTKAGQQAFEASQRNDTGITTHDIGSSKDKLLADLNVLVADAEQAIKEAADSSAEGFAALRTRFEGKLADAKTQLGQAKTAVNEKTRHAANAAHAYVKKNPWQSAGILAVAGAICGLLLSRRPDSKE